MMTALYLIRCRCCCGLGVFSQALTDAGRAWGEALPYSRNGHSGYQILWQPEVAELLREVA
jgi:hypothetical protein